MFEVLGDLEINVEFQLILIRDDLRENDILRVLHKELGNHLSTKNLFFANNLVIKLITMKLLKNLNLKK